MASAKCYLCLREDGRHTPECKATPEYKVPLGMGRAWREGVKAAKKVSQRTS